MSELKKCPFCEGRATATLEATGGEWVGLILRGHGTIYPKVCLNCGLVYISKNDCERINKAREDKPLQGKKRNNGSAHPKMMR